MSHIAELLTYAPFRLRGLSREDRIGLFVGLAAQLPTAQKEYAAQGRSLRLRIVTRSTVFDPLWMSMAVDPTAGTLHVFPVVADGTIGYQHTAIQIDDVTEIRVYEPQTERRS